jgi:DNA (cytosine-5)-methyltransferase 1
MGRQDYETETLIAHTLKGEGFDASEDGTGRGRPIVPMAFMSNASGANLTVGHDQSPTLRIGGDGGNAMAVTFSIMPMNSGKDFKGRETEVAQPVMAAGPAGGNQGGDCIVQPTVIMERGRNGSPNLEYRQDGAANAILTPNGGRGGPGVGAFATLSVVRRLTPRECERLQGFPDHYTLIPYRNGGAADGPRYKALGNSMAVPVMTHIGRRIQAVEAIFNPTPANDTQPKESAA